MIDNVYSFVEDRAPVKEELINQSGALANMLGDPNRPKMKESIMDQWLLLPPVQDLGITKGDQEYREVLSSLDTLKGRQEFSIDFVTGLSIKNNKILGFEVDFAEIKSITEPKFEVVKEGNISKFAPTEIYNISSSADKVLHYNSYLQAIIQNQTRSKNTPDQLRTVALQFMQDISPPDGRTPEEVLNSILDPESDPEYVPPQGTMTEYNTDLTSNQKKKINNSYTAQVARMQTLNIVPENIETSVVISKLNKLDTFTSYAESRNNNNRISSEGAKGFMQFFTNDPDKPDVQKSLHTAFNRLKKHTDAVKDFTMPKDLQQLAANGFVSLENVSRESQGLLVISNYIEDAAVDIKTGERLPTGTGSAYMTAYLEATPGSLEEKQALQNLYYNVQHKAPKIGVGVDSDLFKKIENNFETSYNKVF